jgi:predicted DCC family thiol-disulfide oxidoreductase YuxK
MEWSLREIVSMEGAVFFLLLGGEAQMAVALCHPGGRVVGISVPTAIVQDQIPDNVLFFDSDCLLCDRAIIWLTRCDPSRRLFFSSLTGETASEVLPEEVRQSNQSTLNSVILVQRQASGEWLLSQRSEAILRALEIGGGAPVRQRLLAMVPRVLRDFGYEIIARLRYAVFGRVTECSLQQGAHRDQFLS